MCDLKSERQGVRRVSSVCSATVFFFKGSGGGSARLDTQPDVTSAPGCDTADNST